ncbi:GH32 C-terminal domain-containing protein [Streptomyces tricolor]
MGGGSPLARARARESGAGPRGGLPGARGNDLPGSGRGPATVTLVRAADRTLTVRLDPDAGTVVLDRSGWPRAGAAGSAPVTVRVPPAPRLSVRLLADGSLLELFVADRATVTERVYARPDDVPELTVEGDAEVSGWEQVPPRRG